MKKQPARRNALFGKAYADFGRIFVGAFGHHFESIRAAWGTFAENSTRSGFVRIFLGLLNTFRIISVAVFGTAITILLSLLHLTVLAVLSLILSIVMLITWLIDTLYLSLNGIFKPCPHCKQRSRIPIYVCPQCGARHDALVPSVYGIFSRTCTCGHKLPTAFFNGRGRLSAICPHCDRHMSGRESRPLCIPVIGGRSVGKTAFITAFSYDFIENISRRHGLTVEFDSDEERRIYENIHRDYEAGTTRITHMAQDINTPSSEAFSFFVSGQGLNVDRQIFLYDIAGEIFMQNMENELQRQYEYCHGIVLVIDPFSIYDVRRQYELELADNDKAGISHVDTDAIITAFYRKLAAVTGMGEKQSYDIPLAVVINKCDSPGVRDEIGDAAVRRYISCGRATNYYGAQDALCREFLIKHGMGNIINLINFRFPNNRFFACSAIGHAREAGRYSPIGASQPVEWIARSADKAFGAVWNDTQF